MFPLHERTQRRLCRAAFIVFCIVPVVGVLVWAVSIRLPTTRRALLQQFENELGLAVEIESFAFPRPEEVVCQHVTLRTPGGGDILATIDRLRISPIPNGNGRVWRAEGVRTESASHGDIVTAFSRVVRSDHESNYLLVTTWTIAPSTPGVGVMPLEVDSLDLRFHAAESRAEGRRMIQAQCRLANSSATEIARFEITIPVPGSSEPLQVEFDTGNTLIPCWTFAEWLPVVDYFGPSASFNGSGLLWPRKGRADVKVMGEIRKADFTRASGMLAVGGFRARGSLKFDSLRLRNGGLESVRGSIQCAEGAIDPKVVDAAVRALYCVRPEDRQPPTIESMSKTGSPEITFDELAFRFAVDATGIAIWGSCTSAEPSVMIARGGTPILMEPQYQKLPLTQLVLFIAPHYMPATHEAQAIAKAQAIASQLPFPGQEQNETIRQATHTNPTDTSEGVQR